MLANPRWRILSCPWSPAATVMTSSTNSSTSAPAVRIRMSDFRCFKTSYRSLLFILYIQAAVLIFTMILHRIGRHSKSLDTQRFVCALCTGQLVLLTPSKPRAPTPFASFVKENYGTVRQELAGQSHAEVMRKLSADFSSKAKLSQS